MYLGSMATGKKARLRLGVVLHHAHGADDHVGRAFHFGEMDGFRLKELGSEQGQQHGPNFVPGIEVGLLQDTYSFRVPWFLEPPRRDWHVVSHEEVVQLPGDEAGGGGLLADDVNDVLAVPAPGFTQERLFAVIVVRRVEAELKGGAAIGEDRDGGSQVPAGKGTGASFDVVLGVN